MQSSNTRTNCRCKIAKRSMDDSFELNFYAKSLFGRRKQLMAENYFLDVFKRVFKAFENNRFAVNYSSILNISKIDFDQYLHKKLCKYFNLVTRRVIYSKYYQRQ